MKRAIITAALLLTSLFWYGDNPGAARAAQQGGWTFVLNPSSSTFIVHAHRGGMAWFKGRDHLIAVRNFRGGGSLTLNVLEPAEVGMTIQADSLEETSPDFTPDQKAIIKKELNDIVLEVAKYPTINFESTSVRGSFANGPFKVEIGGRITLHGVTRPVKMNAVVTLDGSTLNAKGHFSLKRSDFGVNATSAFHGWVRVQDKLDFDFDINARPSLQG